MGEAALARSEPLDTSLDIETPEQVRFRYQLAGPARRSLAYFIDLLVRGTLMLAISVIAKVLGGPGEGGIAGVGAGVTLVSMFVIEWGYYVLCETLMAGQSVGKRALNLRVVKSDGLPVGFADSVLRNLVRAADFLPWMYSIGFLVMAFDSRFRRLGDMVAGTLVISEDRPALREPVKIAPAPSPHELARLPADLRLSQDVLDSIELFLRRHGEIGPSREEELAEIIAPPLSRRLGIGYRYAPRFLALLYAKAYDRGGP